jgi:hypothetical protein
VYGHGFQPELLTLLAVPFLTLLGGPEDDPDEEGQDDRSQLSWLRSLGDREALVQIMERDTQLTRGLDAAEALAELGDVRGLDHLISALNSPSSDLRHQAAQILKRLDHPRGLRALEAHPMQPGGMASSRGTSPQPGGSNRNARREQLYRDLNARDTDELVAIWHENDRSQWSDLAFEIMEAILIERLGKLPLGDDAVMGRRREEIDENSDPKIQELWMRGDVDALMDILAGDPDVSIQLEAAEALADLGDEEALDLLIRTLEDPEKDYSGMAAEILDWLELPRGNAALQDHGFEFENGADTVTKEPEPQLRSAAPKARAPAAPRDSWVANQQMPPTSLFAQTRIPQGAASQPVWQQQDASPVASFATLLTGAAGGALGFLLFRLGLHVLGLLPLPQDPGDWLQTRTLYFLAASVIMGASSGTLGSRIAQAIAGRLGWEIAEGDLLPVIGALLEGATAALVVDVLAFFFLGA